jgi:hypothetical protein
VNDWDLPQIDGFLEFDDSTIRSRAVDHFHCVAGHMLAYTEFDPEAVWRAAEQLERKLETNSALLAIAGDVREKRIDVPAMLSLLDTLIVLYAQNHLQAQDPVEQATDADLRRFLESAAQYNDAERTVFRSDHDHVIQRAQRVVHELMRRQSQRFNRGQQGPRHSLRNQSIHQISVILETHYGDGELNRLVAELFSGFSGQAASADQVKRIRSKAKDQSRQEERIATFKAKAEAESPS